MGPFFVLSGYLITGIILRGPQRQWLGTFWQRRTRRIFPAIGLLLIPVALMLRFYTDGSRVPEYRNDLLGALTYTTNWLSLGKRWTYDQMVTGLSPFAHLWSVAVEEQFYLLWALVLAVPVLRRHARLTAATMVLIGCVAMTTHLLTGASHDRIWVGTDVRALEFGAGALLATGSGWLRDKRSALLGGSLLVGTFALWPGVVGGTPLSTSTGILFTAGTAVLLIAGIEADPRCIPARILTNRVLVALGTLSYGFYLWHIPVLWFLRRTLERGNGGFSYDLRLGLIAATTSLALASLSWYLVEAPLLGRRREWKRLFVPTTIAVLLLVVSAIVGLLVTVERGVYQQMRTQANNWECPPGSPVCAAVTEGKPDGWICTDQRKCLLYDPAKYTRTILLAGDSTMRGLTPALIDVARDRRWRVVGLVSGCATQDLTGVAVRGGGEQRSAVDRSSDCREYRSTLEQTIKTWNVDMVIASRGVGRLAWNVPAEFGGGTVAYDDPRFPAIYGAAVERIHAVTAAVSIPLVVLMPVESAEPPGCRGVSCTAYSTIGDPAELRKATLAEREVLLPVLSEHKDVMLYDPKPLVCRQDPCPSVDSGFTWRYDGLHYTFDGARLVVEQLVSALDARGLGQR